MTDAERTAAWQRDGYLLVRDALDSGVPGSDPRLHQ